MRQYLPFWICLALAVVLLAVFYHSFGPEISRTRLSEQAFRTGVEHLQSWGHLPETRERLAAREFTTAVLFARAPERMLRRITEACATENYDSEALRYAEDRLLEDNSYQWVMLCGHLAYMSGDIEKCTEHFEQAIKMEPEDWMPYNALGYCYADLGIQLERAEQLLTKAVELEERQRPASPWLWPLQAIGAQPLAARAMVVDSLAWLHYRQRRYREAWGEVKEASRLLPQDPTISYHYAAIKEAMEEAGEGEGGQREETPITPLAIQSERA